jgi:hypothetical protein
MIQNQPIDPIGSILMEAVHVHDGCSQGDNGRFELTGQSGGRCKVAARQGRQDAGTAAMIEYKSEQWDQIRTVVRDALGLGRAGSR